MPAPRIVWLRRDLRLADHAAFCAAAAQGPVIPVFVLDDKRPGARRLGGASRWWLHHSLQSLSQGLARHGARLILRRGDAVEEIARIAGETGAAAVHAIRHHEPWWQAAESELAEKVDFHVHHGNYLVPAGSVVTGSGSPYKIYTPFYRALLREMELGEPLPEPALAAPAAWPASDDLADWTLLPTKPDWAAGFRAAWEPGEAAAHRRMAEFLDAAAAYETDRNLPSVEGTSRLSPHLHWGEISARQVWHALTGLRGQGVETFRGEIGWRDYAQNVIAQCPRYPEASYRPDFERLPWRDAPDELQAWQKGMTGYPIVDAGMRQLWATGWMHNRVRMIAASFLIKHLLIDWRLGERWFWDTLVDADYASNGVNWQWVAGSGMDANLFTRIMAPLLQSEKFDAGAYIRQWVPELAHVADADIHDPSPLTRGRYPQQLIGHREARERALAAYARIKG
jgi:deoxyribodipyrimidine photo-lyase